MSAPSDPLAPWLRARVLALRAATRRRTFPGTVELVAGKPTATLADWTYDQQATDHALRVDVLVRMLTHCACRGAGSATLVHVRPGRHEPSDLDVGWDAAARVAAEISAVPVSGVLLVSRWGWRDLRTGAERTWSRPRTRPPRQA